MIKLFVTGDNHFGRRFDKYVTRDQLIESRFQSLENMVRRAEQETCDFFVVTGDLFDRTSSIPKRDVARIAKILGAFNQRVLILPGNHDYYTENEQLWRDFTDAAIGSGNITLLSEYRPYIFETGGGRVAFYPAFCDRKHSDTNRLDWIRDAAEQGAGDYQIGVAHGALEGLAIDTEGRYFPMRPDELLANPVDVWLLGHAHVTQPQIPADTEVTGERIFNPGTHEQLDLHNKTEGNCFLITLERDGERKTVRGRRIVSGRIRYFDVGIEAEDLRRGTLEEAIARQTSDLPDAAIVRLSLQGSVSQEDYKDRNRIYESCLGRFQEHLVSDGELSEEITADKIRDAFSEISFAAQFLQRLADDPVELQMAYDLVCDVKQAR